MSEFLSAAAQRMGIPEALVRRSAEARAQATGASVDEVLQAWAGGESAPAAAPAPETRPEEAPPEEAPAAEAPEPEPAPSTPEPEPAATAPPAAQRAPAAAAVTRPPAPERVTPEEALDHEVVVSVPTAGLTERTTSTVPRWLASLFVIVPAIGLLYLAGNPGGASVCAPDDTSPSIQLPFDRQSGELVNCDGSEFEGRGTAGGGGQFLSIGQTAYQACAQCHGAQGQGQGAFPALTGVLTTFGSCADHVEWVTLGSSGFQAAGRQTYGDIAKPVNGGMPSFAGTLTEEQVRAVAAFERVRFGGANPDEELVDCGLVEPEEGAEDGAADAEDAAGEGTTNDGTGDEGTADADAGTNGEGGTTTTAPPEAAIARRS